MSYPSDQLFCLRWNNHQANIVEVFDKLLVNETFTDVTLAVDNGVFVKCHKMVLAACSTYFQALFSELPCRHPIVVLKDIKYAEIKEILEYMYTGQVKIAKEHLPQFIRIGNVLKVKGIMSDGTSVTIAELITRGNDEATSTSTSNVAGQNMETNDEALERSSPPHSTSSPCYGYGKTPISQNRGPNDLPSSMWSLRSGGQNLAVDLAATPSSLPARRSPFPPSYDNGATEASTTHDRKNNISTGGGAARNHDTPILRTVLGQGHADSSLPRNHPDEQEYRSRSNESANTNDGETGRESTDAPHGSYALDASAMEDDDKKLSPLSYVEDSKSGIANYVPAQKPEWKRYKQYTREDIANAIEAVKRGMSALQAARKYGVPSRTLYDKVKKLGITTSRPLRRGSNGSGASFPYGVGGNANGSIYGSILERENENGNALMDNPAALLETAFAENRDDSRDRKSLMETARTSPSPQRLPLYSHPPGLADELPQQETTTDDIEDQVEDLSVKRRSDLRVIMSPGIAIKEEKIML